MDSSPFGHAEVQLFLFEVGPPTDPNIVAWECSNCGQECQTYVDDTPANFGEEIGSICDDCCSDGEF